jgi:hypothetical protein
MDEHDYLVVRCKRPGCCRPILLHYLGPHSRFVGHRVQGADVIEVRCLSCNQTYSYLWNEIQGMVGPEPPPDFVSHPLFRPNKSEKAPSG